MSTILEIEGLSIEFGGVKAVDDVSFKAKPGEVLSIIGPNGAGKTTLFNLISGIYIPSQGKVKLASEDVTAIEPHELAKRGLSRTFQNLQIFHQMTALENVMVGCHLVEKPSLWQDLFDLPGCRSKNRETQDRSMALLERVGLKKAAYSLASDLSYGALKRLEIARAMALNPKILLLDEPAAGCNAVETEEVDNLIDEISKEGVAILLVEHDMKLVMRISDHVVMLDYGKKLAEGTPQELIKNEKVIEAYLGIHGEKEASRVIS